MSNGSNTAFRPSIGIIGLGAFGRLMAQHLRQHFRLCAYDPALLPGSVDDRHGVMLTSLPAAASCPVVVLATPVNQLEDTVQAIRPYLRPGSLVLDVGSVKLVPVEIMMRGLPEHVEIVATHPLFGPQSARDGIKGLKIAVCSIRGGQAPRVAAFLHKTLGLKVIMTTPEAHDREAAMGPGTDPPHCQSTRSNGASANAHDHQELRPAYAGREHGYG